MGYPWLGSCRWLVCQPACIRGFLARCACMGLCRRYRRATHGQLDAAGWYTSLRATCSLSARFSCIGLCRQYRRATRGPCDAPGCTGLRATHGLSPRFSYGVDCRWATVSLVSWGVYEWICSTLVWWARGVCSWWATCGLFVWVAGRSFWRATRGSSHGWLDVCIIS